MTAEDVLAERLGEISALLTIIIKRDSESQAATILEMSKAGISPTRIATLLGTGTSTVTGTISKAKSRSVAKTSGGKRDDK